jgi:dihydrofolate synthase/folylpolyglutamate synthase
VDFGQALIELDSRQPERIGPSLERIMRIASMLGDPQLTYPTIHITGTNGKTTTSRIVTALTCAHGLATGTYTSPHLRSVTERIATCGREITEEEFAEAYSELLPLMQMVDSESPERVTYFEALTALAFLWFSDKPVGLGVFEVGMGGTWDATNLVAGDVAVICPVSLDHPELGSTVAEVAEEKSGIIKPGKVAVIREQSPEALEVIEGRAADVHAALLLEGRDFSLSARSQGVGGQVLTIGGSRGTYEEVLLPILGEHAARNAAAAVVAVECLFERELSEDTVRAAVSSVTSPGRIEVVGRHPLVILDGAHNPGGAQALAAALRETFAWERVLVVLGVSADKDLGGILDPLAELDPTVYATAYSSSRASDPVALEEACEAKGMGVAGAFDSVSSALSAAHAEASEADLILVTGSLYTVADARRAMQI